MEAFFGIVIVLWFLSPILGLYIGRAKGRSDAMGCLTGLLCGPLVLLMFTLEKVERCQFCKAGLAKGATTCAKCGKDQPSPATATS